MRSLTLITLPPSPHSRSLHPLPHLPSLAPPPPLSLSYPPLPLPPALFSPAHSLERSHAKGEQPAKSSSLEAETKQGWDSAYNFFLFFFSLVPLRPVVPDLVSNVDALLGCLA